MGYGYVALVDESGGEGPPDTPGAFEFIIVSAVIMRVENYQYATEIYNRARRYVRKPSTWDFPKFVKHSSDPQKHLIANLIGEAPLRIVTIIAHKSALTTDEMHTSHGNLYFLLSQFLLERISWVCRDANASFPSGNGKPKIIFSARQSLNYKDFIYYANFVKQGRGKFPSKADWRYIDLNNVVAREHDSCDGLRLADFVASAYARAIEYKIYGITDDRFIRPFGNVIYRYKGKCLGNGLKIFPSEAEATLLQEPRFSWFKPFYGK